MEPTELLDTGATVVDVVDEEVVDATGVVNERMIPFAVPFELVMVTRK
jgi:hypothetical protein